MPSSATISPGDIWAALLNAGASPPQAAGIMGNMQAESGLNPESAGLDSNGQWSYGLINWNTGTYPDARSLVTGNPAEDLANQIAYLKRTGGFTAAAGNDPGTVASNFAHTYERCAACGYNAGSGELVLRAQHAVAFAQQALTGNWASSLNTSSYKGSQYLGLVNPDRAVVSINLPLVGQTTLVSASQARTIKAFAFIGAGGLVMVVGVGVLLAAVGKPVAQLLPGPVGTVARSTGGSRSRPAPSPAPDADDVLAEKAERSRESDAARTGRTQEQRYREASRPRSEPGPGRGFERRRRAPAAAEEPF